jgi:allantoinase
VWTAALKRGVPLTDVVRWMATAPAALAGLTSKGAIAPGRDADLCVLAPAEEFTVDAEKLFHRNAVSAYHGRTLTGVVRRTWLRGREVTGEVPHGKLLER